MNGIMISRRKFALTALGSIMANGASQAFGAQAAALAQHPPATRAHGQTDLPENPFARIEAETGGRLGVAILDATTGKRQGWRMHARFPMCSTFKFLLVSAVLARKDRGEENLARQIAFSQSQVLPNSPVSGPHASGSMTVAELCKAAITRSDNTAANLLLASVGGPPAVTALARSLGDPVTRLDRYEPMLSESAAGDVRDTTTPAAMLADMRELLQGKRLSQAAREQLTAWLIANETGAARLRAGLPQDWRVGDKTGTGKRGTTNDIAIVWPTGPERGPLFVTAYLTGATRATSAQRDAAIAQVGAWAAKTWMAKNPPPQPHVG